MEKKKLNVCDEYNGGSLCKRKIDLSRLVLKVPSC